MGGMARFSAPSERVNSAPMNSNPTESATWTTTSALRRRAWAGPAVRPSYRSPGSDCASQDGHAGASPVAMVTAAPRPSANVRDAPVKWNREWKGRPGEPKRDDGACCANRGRGHGERQTFECQQANELRRVAPSDSRTASSRALSRPGELRLAMSSRRWPAPTSARSEEQDDRDDVAWRIAGAEAMGARDDPRAAAGSPESGFNPTSRDVQLRLGVLAREPGASSDAAEPRRGLRRCTGPR